MGTAAPIWSARRIPQTNGDDDAAASSPRVGSDECRPFWRRWIGRDDPAHPHPLRAGWILIAEGELDELIALRNR
jgi:hypothetical protein